MKIGAVKHGKPPVEEIDFNNPRIQCVYTLKRKEAPNKIKITYNKDGHKREFLAYEFISHNKILIRDLEAGCSKISDYKRGDNIMNIIGKLFYEN